jgi:hypothetical protein
MMNVHLNLNNYFSYSDQSSSKVFLPSVLFLNIFPLNIQGHGDKGGLSWTPNQKIIEALDQAFYQAFDAVEPTRKKYYLAVDVSGSMSQPVLGST